MTIDSVKKILQDATVRAHPPVDHSVATEAELEIRNTQDRKCPICFIRELSKYDKDIFFRRMQYDEFSLHANESNYTIPAADFEIHRKSHIYIYIPSEANGEEIPSDQILIDTITQLKRQLEVLERSGHTSTMEYTKKLDILKSLIELKGKFDGQFVNRTEISTDFKTRLLAQVAGAKEKENSIINMPSAKPIAEAPKVISAVAPDPEIGVNERIEDLERRTKKPTPR